MTTAELIDDVSKMLALTDAELAEMELTRSTLNNQLATLMADLSEENGFYACR